MKKKTKTEDTRWFPPAFRTPVARFIGIDASLTSTGVCIIENGERTLTFTLEATKLTGPDRLLWFSDQFTEMVRGNVTGVAVEGYSYASPFNREALAELGGVLRVALARRKIPTLVVAPPTLRKFILPEAMKGKEQTILASYKRWGVEFRTNDECDAHALARLAELRFYLDTISIIDTSVTQRMQEAAMTAEPLILPDLPKRPRVR